MYHASSMHHASSMQTVPLALTCPALQSMYLVLVTNKSSNILEDLETLRLCGKVVPEYVEALEEEEVRGWPLPCV